MARVLMAWRARVLPLVFLWCSRGLAWPHYLLQHDCSKGLELLVSGETPPPIMGIIPTFEYGALTLAAGCDDEAYGRRNDCVETVLEDGADVVAGTTYTLTHNASHAHGFHLVFLTSSGELAGSQPCGEGSARLVCTTCLHDSWLKRARWTPTIAGPATIALGAAKLGMATPAVTIAGVSARVTLPDRQYSGETGRARDGDQTSVDAGLWARLARHLWWPWRELGTEATRTCGV